MNYWRILQCMSIKIIVQSIVLKLVKILLKTYNIYPISKLEGLTLLLITLYISSFQSVLSARKIFQSFLARRSLVSYLPFIFRRLISLNHNFLLLCYLLIKMNYKNLRFTNTQQIRFTPPPPFNDQLHCPNMKYPPTSLAEDCVHYTCKHLLWFAPIDFGVQNFR